MEHQTHGDDESEQGMSKRKKMKVNGEMLPMMAGGYIRRTYYPPEPRKVNFPKPPDGLRGEALKKWMGETSGKVEAAAAAEWKRWPKERVPDTQIRIEFMAWAWEGRLLGEHVKSIDGGEINKLCQLVLPDGTVIEGRTVDLPNDRIQTNAAILREERESGVSYVRLHPDDLAEVRAIGKGVALQGEMLDAATNNATDFIVAYGSQVKLDEQEQAVAEAWKEHKTLSAAARALEIKYGKGKGFSQPNVVKIADRIKKKISGATGRNPKSLFTTQEPERHDRPPDGTLRR